MDKFKNLKTYFNQQHKKVQDSIPKRPTGVGVDDEWESTPSYVPTWKHYEEMLFLLDGPAPREGINSSAFVDHCMV